MLTECLVAASLFLVSQAEKKEEQAPSKKIYFADLQFVIDTKPEGSCDDSKRRVEKSARPWAVELNPQGQIVRKAGKNSVHFYALNVVLQSVGFDNTVEQFSILDGVVPEGAGQGLRVRRQPGNFILIMYLDQTFKVQLSQAPIYSFAATEKRGSCTIQHSINLFADRMGSYPPVD